MFFNNQSYKSVEKQNQQDDLLNFGLDLTELNVTDESTTNMTYGKKIYILSVEKKEPLVEGYRYIKELIYEQMALKMYTLFNLVVSKGITPNGIKTDAILVSNSEAELKKLFKFDPNEIGGLKSKAKNHALTIKSIKSKMSLSMSKIR